MLNDPLADGPEIKLPARFEVLRLEDAGAHGVVWRVFDRDLQRIVALKTLRVPDLSKFSRLKREFRALMDIRHPNLVELYELFSEGDEVCFTMELVEGKSLTNWFASAAGSPMARLERASRQLVAAIQTLHQNDRLHRDIKPSNILVTAEGRLVLLDFGLTTVLDALDGDSLAGRPAGTPLYMAPECISGMPVSPTADWYSLGIVLYELLVGEVPWTGHQRQVLNGKRYGPIPRASARVEVAPELDQLIADLLQVDPDLRPDGDAILSVLARLPSVQMPIPPRRPDRTERRLPFIGRAQEIGRLLEALESVDSHAPSVALVTGPSGIGKSELVQHFALRMRGERGAHVLRGRCNLREAVPYKGFDQIIDGVVNWLLRLDPRTLQEVMPREPWPLFRLFPVMGKVAEVMPSAEASDPGQPVEPAEMRRRGLLVLRALLVEMAAERPLIVWIDDVHWADSDFASVLAELLVGADAPGLLWILGFRDDGTPDSAVEELDAVWDRCGIEPIRVSLGPLEPRHVRALVSELFPVGRSDEDSVAAWTEQILQAGGDIPFLLGELVRQITHLGPSEAIDAASLVLRRAATLPADGRRILDVVCVIGRWVDRRLVWTVGTLQEGAQIAIFELERARFIRISRMDGNVQVAPYHDKVREAVVAALSDEDRRELHRKVVEAMLARNQPGVDIIDHWIGAGEPAQAARAARTAAEHALQTLAFREAARLFGQAIDLGGADPILLERHAEALVFAGRNAQAAARYQALAARDAPAPELLRLRAVAGELLVRSGQIEAGMEAFAAVMAALGIELPRTPRRALALTLWRRFTAILRGVDRPVSQQQKSLDPAQSERLDTLMRAVTSLSMVHPLRADALCAQLLIEVSNLADPSRRANAFALEAAWEATLPLGNLLNGRIEGLLNRSMGLAAETGRAADLEMALTARGISAYHQGRWEEAHAHIEQALRSLSAHGSNHWAVSICQIYCSHALALQGKLEALRPLRRAMIDGAERHADQVLLGALRTGEPALIDLLDEGPEASFARGEAAIAIWPAGEFLSPHYYHLISSVNALLALGRVEEAWTRMESRWPLAEEAMLVNVKVVGPHLRFTRGRVALHRFFQSGDPAALAVARACARHLRWSWSRTSQAWGAALQASLTAALRPQDRQAALRQAQEALGAANLGLYRWAASAQCLDHTVEVPLSSLSSTRARRVLHPRRLADLLMPMPRREI